VGELAVLKILLSDGIYNKHLEYATSKERDIMTIFAGIADSAGFGRVLIRGHADHLCKAKRRRRWTRFPGSDGNGPIKTFAESDLRSG